MSSRIVSARITLKLSRDKDINKPGSVFMRLRIRLIISVLLSLFADNFNFFFIILRSTKVINLVKKMLNLEKVLMERQKIH